MNPQGIGMTADQHAHLLADSLRIMAAIVEEILIEGLDPFTEERLADAKAALAAWESFCPAPTPD